MSEPNQANKNSAPGAGTLAGATATPGMRSATEVATLVERACPSPPGETIDQPTRDLIHQHLDLIPPTEKQRYLNGEIPHRTIMTLMNYERRMKEQGPLFPYRVPPKPREAFDPQSVAKRAFDPQSVAQSVAKKRSAAGITAAGVSESTAADRGDTPALGTLNFDEIDAFMAKEGNDTVETLPGAVDKEAAEAIARKKWPIPEPLLGRVEALALSEPKYGTAFVKTLIDNKVTIPDHLCDLVLEQFDECPKLDRELQEYLRTGNKPADKFNDLITGHNFRPEELPLLIYPTREELIGKKATAKKKVACLDFGKYIPPDIDAKEHIPCNRAMLDKLVDHASDLFGLKLAYFKSNLKIDGETVHPQQKFTKDRGFCLYCARCANGRDRFLVMKGKFMVDASGARWIRVTDQFLHNLVCRPLPNQKQPCHSVTAEDGGPGYLLGTTEALIPKIAEGFQDFVTELHKWNSPREEAPDVPGNDRCNKNAKRGANYKGFPAPSSHIDTQQPNMSYDTRSQIVWPFEGWPSLLQEETERCYNTILVVFLQSSGMVLEFSSYQPHLRPTFTNKEIMPGKWPLRERHPLWIVHLCVDRKVLGIVLGGYLFDIFRRDLEPCAPNKKPWVHQICHQDQAHPYLPFMCIANNPLMTGMAPPGAINVPVEDNRQIYVNNINNKLNMSLGHIGYIPGDSPHGGCCYLHNESLGYGQYHPMVHLVLSSVRHPHMQDRLWHRASHDTCLHHTQLGLLSMKEVADELEATHTRNLELHAFAKTKMDRLRNSARVLVDECASLCDPLEAGDKASTFVPIQVDRPENVIELVQRASPELVAALDDDSKPADMQRPGGTRHRAIGRPLSAPAPNTPICR